MFIESLIIIIIFYNLIFCFADTLQENQELFKLTELLSKTFKMYTCLKYIVIHTNVIVITDTDKLYLYIKNGEMYMYVHDPHIHPNKSVHTLSHDLLN